MSKNLSFIGLLAASGASLCVACTTGPVGSQFDTAAQASTSSGSAGEGSATGRPDGSETGAGDGDQHVTSSGGASRGGTSSGGSGGSGSDGEDGGESGEPLPTDELIGWASVEGEGHPGTTGGKGGDTVTASSRDELNDYLARDEALVIEVAGTIEGSVRVTASNKTIAGTAGRAIASKNAGISIM